MSEERKSTIYHLAQRLDLTIIEDDPYFFLNLTPASGLAPEPANMPGTTGFPKSLLSRDMDGRVVRLDSASKFLAPAYRIGWITCDSRIADKFGTLSEVTTWSISGWSQLAFLETLDKMVMHEHLQQLQSRYAMQRDYLLSACEHHLSGVCEWECPGFGMFVFLRIPGVEDCGGTFVEQLI
eukprot:TRINITY_DN49068_c0_g1_i2.p1 TRINITY_DN49068_c0_g1~~TRINITY_DN49068_c0_g1_i2.p1  ORF type:complete len:181 (-),score=29.67 TRINITY_DN49068_c0_g1_i2:96-638(-)